MTLYVLKRTNGFYGIFKNGRAQKHLIHNNVLYDWAETLIDRILLEAKGESKEPVVIFSDNENEFAESQSEEKEGLPSLAEENRRLRNLLEQAIEAMRNCGEDGCVCDEFYTEFGHKDELENLGLLERR